MFRFLRRKRQTVTPERAPLILQAIKPKLHATLQERDAAARVLMAEFREAIDKGYNYTEIFTAYEKAIDEFILSQPRQLRASYRSESNRTLIHMERHVMTAQMMRTGGIN